MIERLEHGLRGIYRDRLIGADGAVRFDSGWTANTIVDRCRILLAGFIKNTPTDGLSFMAVGQGRAAWDQSGPPPPDPTTTTALETPYAAPIPVDQLQLAYLNDRNDVVSTPTSRLQVTATMPEDYPAPIGETSSYPLREFGLFARLNGEDYMINCIRHPVIYKSVGDKLIRVVRLFF
jgi:hypothetical protein